MFLIACFQLNIQGTHVAVIASIRKAELWMDWSTVTSLMAPVHLLVKNTLKQNQASQN